MNHRSSDTSHPESNARNRRVTALVAALSPNLPPGTSESYAVELCTAFDQAVEFAACDGQPVSTAIAEFLKEDWGPAQPALQKTRSSGRSLRPRKTAGFAPRRRAVAADVR